MFYNIHRRQKNERIPFVMYAYALPHELPNTEKKLLRTERLWMCHILKVLIPNNLIFASPLSVSNSSRAENANVNERQKWKKTEENISFRSILWQMRLWCVLMELNVCIFVIYATYPRGWSWGSWRWNRFKMEFLLKRFAPTQDASSTPNYIPSLTYPNNCMSWAGARKNLARAVFMKTNMKNLNSQLDQVYFLCCLFASAHLNFYNHEKGREMTLQKKLFAFSMNSHWGGNKAQQCE